MDPEDEFWHETIDRFGVEVAWNALEFKTLGDVYDFLTQEAGLAPRKHTCLCPPAFFRLREVMVKELGIPAASITPKTRVARLLPLRTRRQDWKRLSNATGWRFPELEDPPCLVLLVALGAALLVFPLSAALLTTFTGSLPETIGGGLLLFIILVYSAFMTGACKVFQRLLPSECKTVGDLVKYLAALNKYEFLEAFPSVKAADTDYEVFTPRAKRRCARTVAFLKVRTALARITGTSIRRLKPGTEWSETLPAWKRRWQWAALRKGTGLDLPYLHRNSKLVQTLTWGYPIAWVVYAWASPISAGAATAAAFACLIPYAIAAYIATIPFAVYLPERCATLEGLTHEVSKLNYGFLGRNYDTFEAEEVWEILRDTAAEAFHLEAGEITRNTPLTEQ